VWRIWRPGWTDFRVPRSSLKDPSDPAQVAWDVIEPMWNELETPYQRDERLHVSATPGQRALYALHWTNSEVCNGGFHQYFWNSTGMLAPVAVEGARLVGANEYAAVVERALSIFGGHTPPSGDERRERLDRLSDDESQLLDQCDQRWYELLRNPDTELEGYLARHIEKHPDDFFTPSPALPKGS
jgi:hypothetical protein